MNADSDVPVTRRGSRIKPRTKDAVLIFASCVLFSAGVLLVLGGCDSGEATVHAGGSTNVEAANEESDDTLPAEDEAALMRIVKAQEKNQSITEIDIPASFKKTMEENSDICAWLYVPGTNVTLPVAQRAGDDSYYLYHDIAGNGSPIGTPFLHPSNSRSFENRVSVVYGHTYMDIDEQIDFAQLHFLLVDDFFDSHATIKIYLPKGEMLEYDIVSALVFNDTDIMKANGNFESRAKTQEYFDFVSGENSLEGNVHEGITLNASTDRIIQLETCEYSNTDDMESRLVVTGKLKESSSWE